MPKSILPPKLKAGDTLRVVSPSRSLATFPEEHIAAAHQRLTRMGFNLQYGEHARERDRFDSSSIASRIEDLHAAFADDSVQGIIATVGGWNSHQLLPHLDYDLIAAYPKPLWGYSDITALAMGIYAMTGLVTYSGPHLIAFSTPLDMSYSENHLMRCLMTEGAFEVRPSRAWHNGRWYLEDDEQTREHPNPGMMVLNEGQAEGVLLGGNASTIVLLHGTPYMPDREGTILLIEDDYHTGAGAFDRYLTAIIQQPGFEGVRGILIGRFQQESGIDIDDLRAIIASKPELARMPVVAEADFGHTMPVFTFPIGGTGRLAAIGDQAHFEIAGH